MNKRLWSILTDDMDHCFFTGANEVERHHVYSQMGGHVRDRCEKYGFVVPLRPDLHPNGTRAGGDAPLVDKILKIKCQEYYEANIGTREDFINEFGRSYL